VAGPWQRQLTGPFSRTGNASRPALPGGAPIGCISAKTFILAKEIRAMRTKSLRDKKSFRDHLVDVGE
jgi:hypothetical protein